MDAIDYRILDLLQTDNRIPNVKLAEMVGLSPPACSRRVSRLRRDGVIIGDVSVVDQRKLGTWVSVVVTVSLAKRSRPRLEEFQAMIRAEPRVRSCLMTAGSIDFVITANLPSVEDYVAFAEEVISGHGNVKSYESWVVLRTVKDDRHVPLPSP